MYFFQCAQRNTAVSAPESNMPVDQIPDETVEEGEEFETLDDANEMLAVMGMGGFGSTKVRCRDRCEPPVFDLFRFVR